jgi:5-methylcytosine-specific restriction endonuclease McrA
METGEQAPFIVCISPEELRRQKEKAGELRRTQWWKRQTARGVCRYCHKKTPPAELTMDHIVPLIRGGKSTRSNIAPACKECNSRKKHLLPIEWDQYVQRISGDAASDGDPEKIN